MRGYEMSEEKPRSNCAICDVLINVENDSKEHVINEAIGGRLSVKGFICKHCNNVSGQTWDAKLSSQLLPLSLMFGVARQKGKTPMLPITTTAGEELTMKPDGGFIPSKPSYSKNMTPNGVKIQVTARSLKEARNILDGVKRKYPTINIDQILEDAQVISTYPKGMVHHQLEFGGEHSGRSIVKSAFALAVYAGISKNACSEALNYLRDQAATPCFGYYYATDLIATRPPEVPLHCVSIEASPHTGLILGYVEYFGVQRVVLCLGRNYSGDLVRSCYAIDPRKGEEINLSVTIGFTELEIEAIYDYKMIPDGALEDAFAKLMPAVIRNQFEAERDRVISDAVEYALANCGAKPGEIITDDQARKLSSLITQKLTPFIV
ncbi:MAG: HNH endonuclease, partial [Betaproteobacteria bacterium]|nr:HNH endonuclease [Betaproteobacteria bacterium]